jgi:hypothetical protein
MYLILYSGLAGETEKRLISTIVEVIPKINIVFCRTLQELHRALLGPSINILAVLIIISDMQNLESIITLRERLRYCRVILLLPNSDQDLVAAGHTLWPRFVSSIDADFKEIVSVLNKMINTLDTI